MKQFFKNNGAVLIIYVLLLLTAGFFMYAYERNTIHLYVNQYVGNRYVNAFFFLITYLGDGRFAPLLLLAICVVNMRAGFTALLSLISAALLAAALKHLAFDDAHRPYYIFQYFDRHELNLVEGVHVYIHNSFPSGHSTQAFAIFMSIVFIAKKQLFKFFFLGIAVLSAFSRVYLSQHWLADIVAGSILGSVCSIVFYFIYIHADRVKRLDRPLMTLFEKKV